MMDNALEQYAARRDAEVKGVNEIRAWCGLAASRVVGRREDVEDVTQQTFLKLGARGEDTVTGAWFCRGWQVNGAMDLCGRMRMRRAQGE